MAKLSEILRSGADGALLWFCPGCQMAHMVRTGDGVGPRWVWNGSVEKPTLNPSVLVQATVPLTTQQLEAYDQGNQLPEPVPLVCHSFVSEGHIQFLADCTHALAGQTVPIPPFHPDDD